MNKFKKNIEDAIQNGELQLYFQSQYLFRDNRLHLKGAEALIRWHHDDDIIIPPDVFIEAFEKNGDIHTLGYFILEEACRILQEWNGNKNLRHLCLAVNVSPLQLQDSGFLEHLNRCVSTYSFDIQKLKIEIIENFPIEGSHCYQVLNTITDMGISIALDDFGTKNSSLNVLLEYPISEIKIDKDFISSNNNAITESSQTKQIVHSINDISKAVGCSVLAEGVESFCQLRTLIDIGITKFQGFLFSKPLPKEEFEEHIQKNGHTYDIGFLF